MATLSSVLPETHCQMCTMSSNDGDSCPAQPRTPGHDRFRTAASQQPQGGVSIASIVLTSRCNLRCAYCRIPAESPPASPSWGAVRVVLDELTASPVKWLRLSVTGGEPLLERSMLTRSVRYVEEHKRSEQRVTYKLLTNGLMLSRRMLSWLRRHAFEIQVSFDGVREAQDLRGKGTFDALDRLFRLMRDEYEDYFRTKASVAMTVVPQTVRTLAASVSYLIESGAKRIEMSPAMDVPQSADGLLAELEEQFKEISQISLTHRRTTGEVPVALLRRTPFSTSRAPSEWGCRAPLASSLTLDANGQYSTCVVATETYTAGSQLTPVLRGAVEALRLDPADGSLDEQRRAVTRRAADVGIFAANAPRHSDWGDCKDCQWVRECSVCPLMTEGEVDSRGSLKVPPLMCAFNQVTAKYRAQFPIMPPPGMSFRPRAG